MSHKPSAATAEVPASSALRSLPLLDVLSRPTLAALALLPLLALATLPAAAQPEEPATPLTLTEAIALALEKNDGIVIERLGLDIAEQAVLGAQGAYDPLLALSTGWRQTTAPVNSAFSGAPDGRLAPTTDVGEAAGSLTQLLRTGGVVAVTTGASRAATDGTFDLLSPAYSSQLGIELRQPLLRDRTIDAARLRIRVAAADRERAGAVLHREIIETVAAVERSYWSLAAAGREVEVRGDTLALAEEQLTETGYRIEAGSSPETEIAQPRAELERRRGDLFSARETLARAENALKLLILDDGDDEPWARPLAPVAPGDVEIVPVDIADAMRRALALRTEIEAADALIARREAEADFAKNGVRPTLDLVVSYDRFGLAGSRNSAAAPLPGFPTGVPRGLEGNLNDSFEQLVDGDFDDARVGLVFSLPLGNRTARAEAAAADIAIRQADADRTRVRKLIRAEVLDAGAALETAAQRIAASRAAREAAEVQLSAERDRFSVGLSTNFLVLTRQNELESARLAEIEALTDYRRAQTEMGRAVGSLLAERGIEVEDVDQRATP